MPVSNPVKKWKWRKCQYCGCKSFTFPSDPVEGITILSCLRCGKETRVKIGKKRRRKRKKKQVIKE